ncbi:MAG: hypothetical protein O8C67_15390 [Candidatus Methanoperedens sp.]|nr:hypothetical protein [Candidatus Methanoperedens sp.]
MIGEGTCLEVGFTIMALVNGSPVGNFYMMETAMEHQNLVPNQDNIFDSHFIAACMGIEDLHFILDHIDKHWQDFFMSNRMAAPLSGCPG